MRRRHNGYTFTELIATVAASAIVLSAALPAGLDLLHRSQLAERAGELGRALAQTRIAAIRLGHPGIVCASRDGVQCTDSTWSEGWLAWVDRDGDGRPADAERVAAERMDERDWVVTEQHNRRLIRFRPDGSSERATPASFRIASAHCREGTAHRIELAPTGRPEKSVTACR